jgi:hypothetical protein
MPVAATAVSEENHPVGTLREIQITFQHDLSNVDMDWHVHRDGVRCDMTVHKFVLVPSILEFSNQVEIFIISGPVTKLGLVLFSSMSSHPLFVSANG